MIKKFFIRVYGCQMNFADAERLRRVLVGSGWKETENPEEASALLAISCSIRQKAENRVLSFLSSYKHLKKKGTVLCLLGCTANLYGEEILKRFPFIDVVCGPNHISYIPQILENPITKKMVLTGENSSPFMELVESNEETSMMIPITKGCNNFCSYCVVPMARGRLQSKDPQKILKEIKSSVNRGVRYVVLLGQNVNEYGKDFKNKCDFGDLLSDVCKINGLLRVGFLTSHPEDTSKKILQIMAENQNVIRRLHIPLQSGSNKILRNMNRKYTVEKFLNVVEMARNLMPDISITSDILLGFPEETDSDFNETLKIVEKVRFSELYIFKYSPRPGTKAYLLKDNVSKEEKEHRHRVLLETQKKISNEIMQSFSGKTCEVFIERKSIKKQNHFIGKNIQDFPVILEGTEDIIGKIVRTKIFNHSDGFLCGSKLEEYQ
jgi:tRNA-2-methylthio-N6-dimethylallyladenosine synthase